VEDNVDPERMQALLDVIDVNETMFNVVTKSGATSETMAQYLIIMDILKAKFGENAKDHIIATTSSAKGNLIKIAKQEGLKTFYIPDGVGGRFSELCPVGLLPASVLGTVSSVEIGTSLLEIITDKTVTIEEGQLVAQEDLGKEMDIVIVSTYNDIQVTYAAMANVYTMIIDNKAELDQWQVVASENAIEAGICIEQQKGLAYNGYFLLNLYVFHSVSLFLSFNSFVNIIDFGFKLIELADFITGHRSFLGLCGVQQCVHLIYKIISLLFKTLNVLR
jgi:hypothetical protein